MSTMHRSSPADILRLGAATAWGARARRAGVAAMAALMLAACGGGGGEAIEPDAQGTVVQDSVAQDGVVPVAAFEYGFELVTPTSAGTYTFELVNDGTMEHDLKIEGDAVSGGTSIVFPGNTDSFTITLEEGTYTMFCSIAGHRQQGMEITFTVS